MAWNGVALMFAVSGLARSGATRSGFRKGLNAGQTALMYALSQVARSAATRSNYTSALPQILIDGVRSGATATRRVLVASLSIHDLLNENPNTCTFTVQGDRPVEGTEIVITFGSVNNLTRLFAGSILRVTEIYVAQNPQNRLWQVEGIDYTWRLNSGFVNARYRNQSATAIAQDLVARFAPAGIGFSSSGVAAGLPVLDEISFTNVRLMDAIAQIAQRIGGYGSCDYLKVINLWITDLQQRPTPLTAAHDSLLSIDYARDLSQIVTRAMVEGGGVNAAGNVLAGETILPIDDLAWYPPAGQVVSGPQRIRYASTWPGGAGALVGVGGASPTVAPIATPAAGAGLPPGAYRYAYTWTTAAGETIPSPVAAVTVSGALDPPGAPVVYETVGAGLTAGTRYYTLTYADANGNETAQAVFPYPVSGTSGLAAAPVANLYPPIPKYDYGTPGTWAQKGDQISVAIVYGAGGVATPRGPVQQFVAAGYSSTPGDLRVPAYLVTVNGAIKPYGVELIEVHYMRNNDGVWRLLARVTNDPQGGYINQKVVDAPGGSPSPTGLYVGINRVQVPVGPAGVTARKLYRTTAGTSTPFKYALTVSNNTDQYVNDSVPDANLGANVPTVGTAVSGRVQVTGITTGPNPTTGRKLYRTKVGVTQLQALTTIADNTTTTYLDTTADTSLGANAPTSDTAGLVAPTGSVLAGSATIPIASVAGWPTAGWAIAGQQQIRYTGITGNTLTGIPATGAGAITTTLPYGTAITVPAQLMGIPTSGAGAIQIPITIGDPVNVLAQADDATAQANLAALIGGDGVLEGYDTDNRISYTEALARATARLSEYKTALETVRYRVKDPQTRSGTTITVDLPAPMSVSGTFKVQDVTISGFLGTNTYPVYDAVASSQRFTFEDLLRQARGGGATPSG